MQVIGEALFQEQLAALAGPKKETGHYLPVCIVLRAEPWGPRGEHTVLCTIAGRPVGYLDDPSARDPDLRRRMDEALLKGRPLAFDGLIVGGWSRMGELEEAAYEVRFAQEFGHSGLEADLDDLLRLEY